MAQVFGIGEGTAETVPDFDHGGRAVADGADSFVKAEARRTDRAGLEQFLGKLERLNPDVVVQDTFDLVGRRVPQFAAE